MEVEEVEEVRGEEVRGEEEVREEEVEGGGDGPTTISTKKVSHLVHDRSSRSWCAGCQWWPQRHGCRQWDWQLSRRYLDYHLIP